MTVAAKPKGLNNKMSPHIPIALLSEFDPYGSAKTGAAIPVSKRLAKTISRIKRYFKRYIFTPPFHEKKLFLNVVFYGLLFLTRKLTNYLPPSIDSQNRIALVTHWNLFWEEPPLFLANP
jgi:hypothetical protein